MRWKILERLCLLLWVVEGDISSHTSMFWLIWVSLNWIWRPGQLIGLWSLLFIITTQDLKEFFWDWSTWAFAYLNFSVPLLIHLDSRYFLISVCHCGAWPTCEICCLIAKLCPTLCYVMDCSPPGSSVCGISQARILEWVAISFSRWSSWPRDWICVSCTGRRILYHWATREALKSSLLLYKLITT